MESYTVTEDDLRGDISEFPIEVVQAMVDAQTEQGNAPDVRVFQEDSTTDMDRGGFNWDLTIEGQNFWSSVINGNFELYFQKYYH